MEPHRILEVLEYVKRYLIDSQIAFFQQRGDRHDRDATKTMNRSTWAVMLASVCTGGSGFLAAFVQPHLAALAAVGVGAAGFVSYYTTREMIRQDRSNAERYWNTRELLQDLYMRLDDVRKLAAAGRWEPVVALHESAEKILVDEHRQWLEKLEERSRAIAELDASLEQLRRKNG